MPSRRILVIEDHADTLSFLTRVLIRLGHRVTTAATCADARQEVAEKGCEFDLILGDVGMPDCDGAALMGELKQRCRCDAVAISGFGEQQDMDRYRALGIGRCLVKPVSIDRIAELLDEEHFLRGWSLDEAKRRMAGGELK